MNVPNENKVPFREMTVEERSEIVESWLDGNIEALTTGNEWSNKIEHISHLYDASAYRTKPRQLIIPWDVIKPEYKWAAMDEDGGLYIYTHKPEQDSDDYIPCGGCMAANIGSLKINTTGIDWRESLVQRPEGV